MKQLLGPRSSLVYRWLMKFWGMSSGIAFGSRSGLGGGFLQRAVTCQPLVGQQGPACKTGPVGPGAVAELGALAF